MSYQYYIDFLELMDDKTIQMGLIYNLLIQLITLCSKTKGEKSYKSFKPDVFPPPCIQNITGNNSLDIFWCSYI